MSQINLEVNGRSYTVGCQDGQEQHLLELGRMFDRQVRHISQDMGQLGDTRLFLMGALLLADELSDLKLRFGAVQTELARLQGDQARIEQGAIAELDAATARIEALAG